MRRSLLRAGFVVVAALMVTGSAFGQQTTFNYDRTTDFTKFKTYQWVLIDGAQHPDPITAGNISTIVDELLAAKGLVEKDAEPVDLLIGYGTTIQEQQLVTGYGGGVGMTETSTIQNGTILVDAYNPAGKLLVWRGTVTGTINPSSNADKNYKKLKSALTKLLKNFPPPVKK